MLAKLILEDETVFVGRSFGSEREAIGEMVFNTNMTGTRAVLSDPSYYGQIVTMTYPLVGNYGVARDDVEAAGPHLFGLVVRERELIPSNWRARFTLDDILQQYDIPGISGIDTRMLTRKLRQNGTMKGMITVSDEPVEQLLQRLQQTSVATDQVARVSTPSIYRMPGEGERIVLIDFGMKNDLMQALVKRGCDVTVVPFDTTAEQIRQLVPDGIVLSSGPGDPKHVTQAIETVQQLLGEYPLLGIGLGHQLFALACGADTEKMKFGHHGANYPVKDRHTGRSTMTSQHHLYTVTEHSVAKTPLEITEINSNDRTIEALRHKHLPAISVQYEVSGADGSGEWFDHFLDMIRQVRREHPTESRQAVFARAAETKGELQYAQK